jgi:cytochrome P450
MLSSWVRRGETGVKGTDDDTATLALHVLTGAGFGQSFSFDTGLTKLTGNHRLNYRDALRAILANVMGLILIRFVPISLFFSGALRKLKDARDEFGQYMVEMVEGEREAVKAGVQDKANLMSVLVRSADADKEQHGRSSMTDEEIYGNLFIYNMAGHETVAGALHHSIIYMSAYPELQDWVSEEVEHVLKGTDISQSDYATIFPQLKRCRAIMVSSTTPTYPPLTSQLTSPTNSMKPSATSAPCP